MTEPDPLDSSCAPLPALTNNLSEQASRYYRLHQQQPVAWQIWSDDTFLLAQKYNKPILLLIGYSSCHWCHVMSRDSFEDIETARLMNDHFINICIDREERPDIDSAYQLSHILLNGHSGGWPLIGFLCPYTRLPFFSGTYLPQQGSAEKLGFPQLLQKVHHYYEQQPTDMRRLLMQLQSGIERLSLPLEPTAVPDDSLLSEALEALAATQDNDYGGFGSSPKFPQPVNLSFLLQCHARARLSLEQMGHLTQTLTLIAERGINDRISGGFFRYSIDDAWAQPHFEKMLYDNGLLLQVYARAYSEFKDPLYKSATLGIVRWLRHNMLAPEGGFYSSVDADAGGVEGGHYLISRDDIERELSAQEFELFKMLFALECDSTDPSPVYLSQVVGLEYCARALSLSPDKGLELYQSGRKKLQHILHQNPSVEVDDKILSGCNALMIKGLAVAAQVTQDSALVAMAQQAVDFIHSKLWLNQRLFAGWLQGGVTGHAFLDDYVYLIDSLLTLLETKWRDQDYRFLLNLTEAMLHFHQDVDHGGLFYSASDAEKTVYPHKPVMDAVAPAANAIAAKVLLRVGHLSAEPRYLFAAEAIFKASALAVRHSPLTHLSMVEALEEWHQPTAIVILADDGTNLSWGAEIKQQFGERVLCFCLPLEAQLYPPNGLHLEAGEGVVCVGEECFAVSTSVSEIMSQLNGLFEVTQPSCVSSF